MKVAALCDFPFCEERVGTSVRFNSLCRTLSSVCDLCAISTVSLPEKYEGFRERQPYPIIDRTMLDEIHCKLLPKHTAGIDQRHQASVQAIGHIIMESDYDAVLTPYFNRSWLIEHLPRDVVRIIDTHDCQSQRTRSFARHGMIPTFRMTPEEEGVQLDRYDIVLAMSDDDLNEFSVLTAKPIVAAPFRLPIRDVKVLFYALYGEDGSENLLFVAADSEINRLTLKYLIEEILPLVPRNVVLHVVGKVEVSKGNLPDNVTVLHDRDVDDLMPIYARSALAVNPTYAGGGVKTKTLEALALGLPVLTTDEGARGLRHLIPDMLIANDKATFAWRIKQLLESPDLRLDLARQQLESMRLEGAEEWPQVFANILTSVRTSKLEAEHASC